MLANVTLDDKYTLERGRVFLTGTQALVRLPMLQRKRDLAAGLNTACFISGYRGSPLGLYDQQLWRARKFLKEHHIHFQPGVNEDLAATAVWGSQQLNLFPNAKYDGVFSIWYGKGPGVDRSMDVFKHGNSAGTWKHGGVLVLCGDDHGAASSTVAHQSEHMMMAAMMPMLNPANVQEFLDYGLLGWAMSRYAGVWVGFKCQTETVESSASVSIDPDRLKIVLPEDFQMPPGGLNIRWPDAILEQELRLQRDKGYAALAFARANKIDRVVIDSPRARLGIITTGKSYLDVRQALDDLGIDEKMAADIGIRVYKVGMVWPLEREGARHFAEGLEEVLVVEEKRAVIENQLKEQLYNWREDVRPRVIGKFDETGEWLLPSAGELSPALVAKAIYRRIKRFHTNARIEERISFLEQLERDRSAAAGANKTARIPYFCSGCPHNTSTRVPEGSRAVAGIGCHFMALWMDRSTATFTQMGGEGAPWIGQAPFTNEKHIFANLGDGTYFHSGLLAIRASVAAKVNITYKILYNDAVAMTGGQPHDGQLTPPQISLQVYGEGVRRIVVVTDDPDKYPVGTEWAPGVTIRHRDELDEVQKELREIEGVTVLIYDQTCAAEKRRRRKRGTFPDPDKRIFINDAVCEGCGDCSVKSNCVSVEPLETELGRKRKINQSSCNKDFSCVKGFCPSFVTVHGGKVRRAKVKLHQGPAEEDVDALFAGLPTPERAPLDKPYNILITGIGGTGVVTIGQILGMAAHLEGYGTSVLDFTGLAQKNGAVLSHIRIAAKPDDIHAVRVAAGGANLVLGCDMVVAAGDQALEKMHRGVTRAVINTQLTPTAAFTLNTNIRYDDNAMVQAIRKASGENLSEFLEGTKLATALMGDAIATNMFMLGYAVQRGLVPVSLDALFKAIELNGTAVEANIRALNWGRLYAQNPKAVEEIARPTLPVSEVKPVARTVDELLADRSARLVAYQNEAYANRYRALVETARQAEQNKAKGMTGFAEAVARYAYKLMAYKDEYEVARLYTDGDFLKKLNAQFEGDFKLTFHLAPPLIAHPDPETGEAQKKEFGPWTFRLFRLLAKLKGLRGTKLDIFGYTEERRTERQLVEDYFALINELSAGLSPENHALAVQLAALPEEIRGFGHVKKRNLKLAQEKWQKLLAAFRSPAPLATAAE
ncbi:MAG TPA: indolepyruvate ferredoxin oxidoreductase family protein [Ferrovibrio sp.]|uniref:indolepyruvate ferredoxin oxidoreductase family protein n=1 Tax=Ferrovibrio sp. TaxID=1917215 RepID=UPI002B4AB066|nr:indolepyruvate ferredoxin oxidoreductase family protein [Ferrovibrio sp.]HLT77896.1 indolepyruvate ferredoxin oxidoreductase family protein [Ferrovibrio sp.]